MADHFDFNDWKGYFDSPDEEAIAPKNSSAKETVEPLPISISSGPGRHGTDVRYTGGSSADPNHLDDDQPVDGDGYRHRSTLNDSSEPSRAVAGASTLSKTSKSSARGGDNDLEENSSDKSELDPISSVEPLGYLRDLVCPLRRWKPHVYRCSSTYRTTLHLIRHIQQAHKLFFHLHCVQLFPDSKTLEHHILGRVCCWACRSRFPSRMAKIDHETTCKLKFLSEETAWNRIYQQACGDNISHNPQAGPDYPGAEDAARKRYPGGSSLSTASWISESKELVREWARRERKWAGRERERARERGFRAAQIKFAPHHEDTKDERQELDALREDYENLRLQRLDFTTLRTAEDQIRPDGNAKSDTSSGDSDDAMSLLQMVPPALDYAKSLLQAVPPSDSGYASAPGIKRDAETEKDSDNQTVISDAESLYLPEDEKARIISAFSHKLYDETVMSFISHAQKPSFEKQLQQLLKGFSIELEQSVTEEKHKHAVQFVRQNRRHIASAFAAEIASAEQRSLGVDDSLPTNGSETPPMSAYDKVKNFNIQPGNLSLKYQEYPDEKEGSDEYIESYLEHRIFLESSEYQSLLQSIRTAATLDFENTKPMQDIQEIIELRLKASRRPKDHQRRTIHFRLQRNDFLKFLFWYYGHDGSRDLSSVVVLTGSLEAPQAATCKEYMKLVWPSRGVHVLKMIQNAIALENPREEEYFRFPGGNVVSCIGNLKLFRVIATGSEPFLIEIGQQLGWLCAALSIPPKASDFAYTTSHLSLGDEEDVPDPKIIHLMITPVTTQIPGKTENINFVQDHLCWTELFNNQKIVNGYPILSRRPRQRGLEISLQLMAGLSNANYLTEFDGVAVLKGYSDMFVATEMTSNCSQWHFLYNSNGSRISYLEALKYGKECFSDLDSDHDPKPNPDIQIQDTLRHFVGWAPQTTNIIGLRDFDYNRIGRSRLKNCPPGFVMNKFVLNAGQYITPGIEIGPGGRNKRFVNLGPRHYEESLWSARKNVFVNLFDVEDRRGWLVDGASIVFLLSRSQLSHPNSLVSKGKSVKLDDFKYKERGPSEGTIESLTDKDNMYLVLSEDPMPDPNTPSDMGDRFYFHELVKRNCDLLHKLLDYQHMIMETPGISIRGTMREKLEGWDMIDIISGKHTVKPRHLHLESSSRGWVDFTREIRTITMFGSGLGEIIQPTGESRGALCDNWKWVPKKRDYLAVCTKTLDEICEEYGDSHQDSFMLAGDIYWHKPQLLYEKCSCPQGKSNCDRVQVLLPRLSTRKIRPEPFIEANGAVIFGRSSHFPWSYPTHGMPKEDSLNQTPVDNRFKEALSPVISDSGLGSSIVTSRLSPTPTPSERSSRSISHASSSTPQNTLQALAGRLPGQAEITVKPTRRLRFLKSLWNRKEMFKLTPG